MPVKTKEPKTGTTKCFIHEIRLPVELPYDPFQHHICWICQSRLQELADTNFHFSVGEQIIAVSQESKVQNEAA